MSNTKSEQIKEKIIRHIERTMTYCHQASHDDFFNNPMLQEACILNVLQIGELAAKAIEWGIDTQYPEIEWRQMRGMRNRIVHDYDGIRLETVWETIHNDFPILLEKLKNE